jgi:methylated-DNA-[protein]-cysteine S-methyltransferase
MVILNSPIGPLKIVVDEEGRLTEVSFATVSSRASARDLADGGYDDRAADPSSSLATLGMTQSQLDEYFAGKRQSFDLPLNLQGTEFQLAVWNELLRVPYGETITYAELANRIGRPSAIRAVGAANGANPIPVIVPCHRVIGSNGTLTGYGGGIERKQWLLAHEGRRLF